MKTSSRAGQVSVVGFYTSCSAGAWTQGSPVRGRHSSTELHTSSWIRFIWRFWIKLLSQSPQHAPSSILDASAPFPCPSRLSFRFLWGAGSSPVAHRNPYKCSVLLYESVASKLLSLVLETDSLLPQQKPFRVPSWILTFPLAWTSKKTMYEVKSFINSFWAFRDDSTWHRPKTATGKARATVSIRVLWTESHRDLTLRPMQAVELQEYILGTTEPVRML